jgi:hypothetical protein
MATVTTYKTSSPYKTTPYIDGKFLDILNYRTLPEEADDLYRPIGIKYQFRPDLLSQWLYDSPEYWWVFIVRNRDVIIDPIWDFTSDKWIYLPKKSTVLRNLGG